jgi:hypothetical protein
VLKQVSRELRIKTEELVGKRPTRRDYRALVIEMMYRYGRVGGERLANGWEVWITAR